MIRYLILAALALGCGAAEDNPEFGTVGETFLAPQRGASLRFGTSEGLAALSCDSSTPAVACTIPADKHVNWYVDANVGSTATDRNLVRAQVINFINEMASQGLASCASGGYCFTEVASVANNTTLAILANGVGTGGFCGGALNTAEAYTCMAVSPNDLIEDGGVVNQYKRRIITTLHVDIGDVLARGTDANQDVRGARAAVYNGMLKALGIGAQTAFTSRCSQRITTAAAGWFQASCSLSSTEICALNGFTEINDQTHFGNRQTQCGA